MDAKLQMYYRKKMSRGRSLVARIADFIMLRAIILVILFFVFARLFRSLTIALVIAVLLTAAFSFAMILLQRVRADRFMRKDLQRLKKKCLLEKLTLMNGITFKQYMAQLLGLGSCCITDTEDGFFANTSNAYIDVIHNHPTSVCSAADVLRIYRRHSSGKKRIIITLSTFNMDAERFADALGDTVSLISGDHVLRMADSKSMLPDEDHAWKQAAAEMQATVVTISGIKKNILARTKTRAYIICGIIIMCWPIVAGFQFYYPIIAAICFALALFSFRTSHKTPSNEDIGID